MTARDAAVDAAQSMDAHARPDCPVRTRAIRLGGTRGGASRQGACIDAGFVQMTVSTCGTRSEDGLAMTSRASLPGYAGTVEDHQGPRPRSSRPLPVILLLALLAALALYPPLIQRINISWDEFRFLSDVYASLDGSLAAPLQTFHVHLFAWIARLGGDEIDQILAARYIYFVLLIGTTAFIFLTARRLLGPAAGLFAALCFVTYTDVVVHGFSFRFDGLSAFLLSASIYFLVRGGRPERILASFLSASSLLITIKTIFYLPTLLALAFLFGATHASFRADVRRVAEYAMALAVFFGIGLIYHTAHASATDPSAPMTSVASAGSAFVWNAVLLRADVLMGSVVANAYTWLFLTYGVIAVVSDRRRVFNRNSLGLLALILPLLSLLVYRNSFPYYFVFLGPCIAMAAGTAFEALRRTTLRDGDWLRRLVLVFMVVVQLTGFVRVYHARSTNEQRVQRAIVAGVHKIFSEPATYIDRNSMIASFPKAGFFMSTWGMEAYHAKGEAVFRDILVREQPVFLLVNSPVLDIGGRDTAHVPPSYRLLPEDFETLRDNFVPYWGPVYVAGKELESDCASNCSVEVLISGDYYIDSVHPITIGEREYDPHATVHLARGAHTYATAAAAGESITLRWSNIEPHPREPPPPGPIYTGLASVPALGRAAAAIHVLLFLGFGAAFLVVFRAALRSKGDDRGSP